MRYIEGKGWGAKEVKRGGRHERGQETKEFQTLCSLYFSVVKNKLYLQPGGGGVWRALCEGGAGGHLSTAPLPSPALPQDSGKKGNAPSCVHHWQPRTMRAQRSKFPMVAHG